VFIKQKKKRKYVVYSSLQFPPAPQEQSDKSLCPKEAFIVRNMVSGGGRGIETIQLDRVKALARDGSNHAPCSFPL